MTALGVAARHAGRLLALLLVNRVAFRPVNSRAWRTLISGRTISRGSLAMGTTRVSGFLTGEDSDYVGMARSYQQYLVEKGDLKKVLFGSNTWEVA